MIGDAKHFPCAGFNYRGKQTPDLADRTEALIEVLAHELIHLDHYCNQHGDRHSRMEAFTVSESIKVLEAFRASRDGLLAGWSEAPAISAAFKPPIDKIAKRAEKAAADLARWERKLKLAKTKVRFYAKRVKYYSRKTQPE